MAPRPVHLSLLIAVVCVATAVSATASPTNGFIEGWDTTPSVEGWQNTFPVGSWVASLSNSQNYLTIHFPTSSPPTSIRDTIYNTGVDYTGDYTTPNLQLTFDVRAEQFLNIPGITFRSIADKYFVRINAGISGFEIVFSYFFP